MRKMFLVVGVAAFILFVSGIVYFSPVVADGGPGDYQVENFDTYCLKPGLSTNYFEISTPSNQLIYVVPKDSFGTFGSGRERGPYVEYWRISDEKPTRTDTLSDEVLKSPGKAAQNSDFRITVKCGIMWSRSVSVLSAYKVPIRFSLRGTPEPDRSSGREVKKIPTENVFFGEGNPHNSDINLALAHGFPNLQGVKDSQHRAVFPPGESDSVMPRVDQIVFPYSMSENQLDVTEKKLYAYVYNYQIVAYGNSGDEERTPINEQEVRTVQVVLVYGMSSMPGVRNGGNVIGVLQAVKDFEGEIGESGAGPQGTIQQAEWEITPCPEDVNKDSNINIIDLVTIARSFGQTVPVDSGYAEDVNNDGKVNIIDLVTVARRFGQRCQDAAYVSPLGERVVFVPVPVARQSQSTGLASVLKSIFWVIGN